MKTKLTLTIDKKVIDRAKRYSQKKGRSLSDIVETYLAEISSKNYKGNNQIAEVYEASDAFKELDGCLKGVYPDDMDWNEERAKGIWRW